MSLHNEFAEHALSRLLINAASFGGVATTLKKNTDTNAQDIDMIEELEELAAMLDEDDFEDDEGYEEETGKKRVIHDSTRTSRSNGRATREHAEKLSFLSNVALFLASVFDKETGVKVIGFKEHLERKYRKGNNFASTVYRGVSVEDACQL